MFIGITCLCVLAYFKWIKGRKLFKNKLIIEIMEGLV